MRSTRSRRARNTGRSELSERPARVEVCGLSWRPYGRRDPVLRDLSFVLEPGERVLLVGPSGSGKSTLLRALAGLLLTADSGDHAGTVTIGGHPPGTRPGEVGLVLQEPGAGIVAASVGRDAAFGPENLALPRSEIPGIVGPALAGVGLGMPPDTPTSALSGGETQRLALAGALALRPALLLLDEPTAMLDPGHAAAVRESVLRVIHRSGLTTVVVEHLLEPWIGVADRMLVLDATGELVADGPVRSVLDREHDRLLDMGIWVPGAPHPDPVRVSPTIFGPWPAPAGPGPALAGSVLRVDRATRLLDGATRVRTAVTTSEPLVPAPGSLTAVTGPSGSGKSTLLHTLAGFLSPAAGEVVVHEPDGADGLPVSSLSSADLAARIAWVPQWSSAAVATRHVLDEVLATSHALGVADETTQARACELLSILGLQGLQLADPLQLSGGEQRRLALAAAILHRPAYLLADEPTVAQDRHTWSAVMGLLDGYRRAGGTVVVSTHDEALTARADHRLALRASPQPPPGPPGRRPLASRAGPIALLGGAMLGIPAGIIPSTWRVAATVLAAQLLLAVVALAAPGRGTRADGRLRSLLARSIPGLLGAVSAGWSTWLLGGHDAETAWTAGLRVLIIVLPSVVLLPLIDTDALGDHLAQRLHLPARPVVAISAALQRIQGFGEIWAEISRARKVRALGASPRRPVALVRHLAAVSFALLVRTLRLAADLSIAMDARGFAQAQRRTWAAAAPWRPADSLVLAGALLPVLVAAAVPVLG